MPENTDKKNTAKITFSNVCLDYDAENTKKFDLALPATGINFIKISSPKLRNIFAKQLLLSSNFNSKPGLSRDSSVYFKNCSGLGPGVEVFERIFSMPKAEELGRFLGLRARLTTLVLKEGSMHCLEDGAKLEVGDAILEEDFKSELTALSVKVDSFEAKNIVFSKVVADGKLLPREALKESDKEQEAIVKTFSKKTALTDVKAAVSEYLALGFEGVNLLGLRKVKGEYEVVTSKSLFFGYHCPCCEKRFQAKNEVDKFRLLISKVQGEISFRYENKDFYDLLEVPISELSKPLEIDWKLDSKSLSLKTSLKELGLEERLYAYLFLLNLVQLSGSILVLETHPVLGSSLIQELLKKISNNDNVIFVLGETPQADIKFDFVIDVNKELENLNKVSGSAQNINLEQIKQEAFNGEFFGKNFSELTGLSEKLAEHFSTLSDARIKGLSRNHFLKSSSLGNCSSCKGRGEVESFNCDDCFGSGFSEEVLSVSFKDLNISQVLNLRLDEACKVFANVPLLAPFLSHLVQSGSKEYKLDEKSEEMLFLEKYRLSNLQAAYPD